MTGTITKDEAERRMTELDARGQAVKLECNNCGSPTKTKVLAEDTHRATLCESCILDRL